MSENKNEQALRERYDALSAQERREYSLISLKIKRFPVFNRLYGRRAGDELMAKVFEIVSGWLGDGDCIFRLRLNYFNILLRFPRDYEAVFQRMIDINARIRDMDDPRFPCKVYCGFGIYPLEEGVDFLTAQYNADLARIKCPERDFRNSHFEVYGLSIQDAELRYYDLSELVRPAIEQGHIKFYLQPKVDLRTGEVRSAEALMRWEDPVRGMIPVSEFLPVLESNGIIDLADLSVFAQVCATINRWIETYGKKIQISVNLSASMFNYLYFFKQYREVHEKYNTPADCIEFELLESIVLNQVERVTQVVNELREYGFSCSLDDFGSGFSSYSVLTHSEIGVLKIDRSLFQQEGNYPPAYHRNRPGAGHAHGGGGGGIPELCGVPAIPGLRFYPGLCLLPAHARGGIRRAFPAPGRNRPFGRISIMISGLPRTKCLRQTRFLFTKSPEQGIMELSKHQKGGFSIWRNSYPWASC